jgi:hypothetical protein
LSAGRPRAILSAISPEVALEWFIVSNLGFLGADILIAHSENTFRRREEWIPIIFSAAALVLTPGLVSARVRAALRPVSLAVGVGAILVGVAGMIYHLDSSFFAARTLASLVYAAPFIAPLAYVGVGLLLLLSRLEAPDSPAFSEWVLLLALGGFAGNFGLALSDHAQNGFFSLSEWIPVGCAAFMVAFLLLAVLEPADRRLGRILSWLIGLATLVGVLGFVLHLAANLERPGASLLDRFVFGAPPFAPLLFADLALLAAIGLWARQPRAQARLR